eukprot:7860885-Alexandrium_andersonii.AAC.1
MTRVGKPIASCSAVVGEILAWSPGSRKFGQYSRASPSLVTVGRRGFSQRAQRPYLQGRERARPTFSSRPSGVIGPHAPMGPGNSARAAPASGGFGTD